MALSLLGPQKMLSLPSCRGHPFRSHMWTPMAHLLQILLCKYQVEKTHIVNDCCTLNRPGLNPIQPACRVVGPVNRQHLQPTNPVCQQSWLQGLLSHQYSFRLLTEGWPGWVDLGGLLNRDIFSWLRVESRHSQIQVLTGPDVKQLRWCDQCRYH